MESFFSWSIKGKLGYDMAKESTLDLFLKTVGEVVIKCRCANCARVFNAVESKSICPACHHEHSDEELDYGVRKCYPKIFKKGIHIMTPTTPPLFASFTPAAPNPDGSGISRDFWQASAVPFDGAEEYVPKATITELLNDAKESAAYLHDVLCEQESPNHIGNFSECPAAICKTSRNIFAKVQP